MDPLAQLLDSYSPYNYVLNNPINSIDPDGRYPLTGQAAQDAFRQLKDDWIDNGDGTYTAEKGDGAETLSLDAGISLERAYEIMDEQGHPTYIDNADGILKSAIDPGQVVTVPEQKMEIETTKAKIQTDTKISKSENTIDSLNDVIAKDKKAKLDMLNDPVLKPQPGDDGTAFGVLKTIRSRPFEKKEAKDKKAIQKEKGKLDSLKNARKNLDPRS